MTATVYSDKVRVNLKVTASLEDLAIAAADLFAETANEAIKQRQRFAVALSGGSTPLGLFNRLASTGHDQLDWSHIHVFWVDERPVPPNHPDSNYGSAKIHLLDRVPIPATNLHRIHGELPPPAAADSNALELQRFFGLTPKTWPRFDLIVLGIGEDGHTASLFPGTKALADFSHMVVGNDVTKLGQTRLTITYPVINAARRVVVLASGTHKSEIIREVLMTPPLPETFPIQGVHPQDGDFVWLLDHEAGARLQGYPVMPSPLATTTPVMPSPRSGRTGIS